MSTTRITINKINELNNIFNKDKAKKILLYLLKYDKTYSNVDANSLDIEAILESYKYVFNDFDDSRIKLDILHQEIRNELMINNYEFNEYTRKYHYKKYH